MRALLIDAYDSFVYVIFQYLCTLGVTTCVRRRDQLHGDANALRAPEWDFLVLGPGPGHPRDSGYLPILEACGGKIPILGVCLGHQAIGLAFGATVVPAPTLMHGKTSPIRHNNAGCFHKHSQDFAATRYHSLAVSPKGMPDCLEITATAADDGCIMGLRHRSLAIESLQFHPESIMTEEGQSLFANFIANFVTKDGAKDDAAP